MSSRPENIARKRDFRIRIQKILDPYRDLILFIDTVLLWEKPFIMIGILIAVQLFFWTSWTLLSSFSLITLLCFAAGAGLLGSKFVKVPPTLQVPMSPVPPGYPGRHDYEEIIELIVALSLFVVERFEEILHQVSVSTDYLYILKLCLALVGIALIDTLLTTYLILWFFVFSLLLIPGALAHRIDVKIREFVTPHINHLWTVVEPTANKGWSHVEPHWKQAAPHVLPIFENIRARTMDLAGVSAQKKKDTPKSPPPVVDVPPLIKKKELLTTPEPKPFHTSSSFEDFVEVSRD